MGVLGAINTQVALFAFPQLRAATLGFTPREVPSGLACGAIVVP